MVKDLWLYDIIIWMEPTIIIYCTQIDHDKQIQKRVDKKDK